MSVRKAKGARAPKDKAEGMPTVRELNCLASFVEACGELHREPFFGRDEPMSSRSEPGRKTYVLGDRFHFRSGLISFRRIWMKTEASHWETVVKILRSKSMPTFVQATLPTTVEQIRWRVEEDAYPVKMKGRKLIGLWLNTVFAHDGLTGRTRREDFEAAIKEFGQAQFEYAFRSTVRGCGLQFLNLERLSAAPALEHFRTNHRLEPSFTIGAAFGRKKREYTKTGDLIIREGSSEFFTEETLEERFFRILQRKAHGDLKIVFDHLQAKPAELLRVVLKTKGMAELLGSLEGELELCDAISDDRPPYYYAAFSMKRERIHVFLDNVVKTTPEGAKLLNIALARFATELLEK